ncbi:hypothetical protein SB659_07720 [Arthrobacter sp. SIMBA_036]|uniref:hypothetical protein n=1 Tax=Arthrobacter sp. SIMBA_036 TaxID=3085778 RepID=UPI00397BE79A
MSEEKPTAEDLAAWAARGQEYLKTVDEQIAGWRSEAAHIMVDAARAGTGWAGNKDVEFAVSRLGNMVLMRQVGEQVADALALYDMTFADSGTTPEP